MFSEQDKIQQKTKIKKQKKFRKVALKTKNKKIVQCLVFSQIAAMTTRNNLKNNIQNISKLMKILKFPVSLRKTLIKTQKVTAPIKNPL